MKQLATLFMANRSVFQFIGARARHSVSLFGMLVLTCMSISLLFGSTPVYAQEVGFTQCQFDHQSASQEEDKIQKCLGQIFQFTFVVGMFIIAIRVALFALGNYNPFDNGKAVSQSINIVWEATLGFILLGSPVLFINILNPAALNLSFLQIGTVGQNSSGGGQSSGGTTQNGSGSTTSGGSTGGGTLAGNNGTSISSGALGNAVNVIQNQGNTTYNDRIVPLARLPFSFGINAYAQDTAMTQEEAITIISDVLKAELQCSNVFISQQDYDNCQVLGQSDFIEQRNRINERIRELYTPLLERSSVYTGLVKTSKKIQVDAVDFGAIKSDTDACKLFFVSVTEIETQVHHLISTEYCNGEALDSVFFTLEDTLLKANTGQIVEAGDSVMTTGILRIHS